ncbi:MAG: trigger factor [Candidatus Krumholzibacteriia bacterium]
MTESARPTPEGIATTVESPEPWKRVIKAEVQRSAFDQAYAKLLQKAVKSHQKPGFRKGRTPRALVEKEVGDLLRVEAIEALVPRAWMAALLEHKIPALTDPALENLSFEDGKPLTFDLVVEVRPEITAVGLDAIPVKRRDAGVPESEVDEVLDRLRESRSTFTGVDRPAAEGDRITLDLTPREGLDGDQPRTIADQTFVLGAENNLGAFNDSLRGCAAGEEKDITVEYPADYPNESLKGRSVVFGCRIKEVAEKVLPALDDAFAGEVEEGKTLDELRAAIRGDLEKEAERRVGLELDHQVQMELIRRNDVPLPPSMVERYLQSGLEELHRRNARTGRPGSPEEDREYLEAGRTRAERDLKAMLLLEAVRDQEGIKVTDEDVEERITEVAEENGFDVDRYREFVNSGDEKDRIRYNLLERRTLDFLLSRADITDVPADTEVLFD